MRPRACRRRPSWGFRIASSARPSTRTWRPRPGRTWTTVVLRRLCAEQLEDHKVPQRVLRARGAAPDRRGKVDRQALIAVASPQEPPRRDRRRRRARPAAAAAGAAAASTKLAADAGDVRVARGHPRRLVRRRAGRCSRSAARSVVLARPGGRARDHLTAVAWGTVRLPGRGTRRRRSGSLALGLARMPGWSTGCGPRGGPDRGSRSRWRRCWRHRSPFVVGGPVRDPRHRAQPGHVAAPVRGRRARRTATGRGCRARATRSARTPSSSRSRS